MVSNHVSSASTIEDLGPSASPSADPHRFASGCRLTIISRHQLCRDALAATLARVPALQLLGVMTPEDACRCTMVFDVTVIDARLGLDGVALVDHLRKRQPRLSVVVFGAAPGKGVQEWTSVRTTTHVDADGSAADITVAVLRAVRGGPEPSRGMPELALSDIAPLPSALQSGLNVSALTPREQVILQMAAEGLANKEIARCLKITESTVKNHMHNVLGKMGARRRGEAVARFQRECRVAAPLASSDSQPAPPC